MAIETLTNATSTQVINITEIIISEITWGLFFIFIGVFSIRAVTAIQHVLGFSAIISIIAPLLFAFNEARNGTLMLSDIGNYILFAIIGCVHIVIGNKISKFVMPILEKIYDFFYNLVDDLRG
jgi:hypothetical protein